MNEKIPILMLGMARYKDWQNGVYNRQLEILNQMRKRPDLGPILFVDMTPWQWRQAVKFKWQMSIKGSSDVAAFKNFGRRLQKIDDKLFILSSIHRIGAGDYRKLLNDINEAEKAIGIQEPIVWSYVPITADLVSSLPRRLCVFDAVDNWLEHPSYKIYKHAIAGGYQKFSEISDLIFTVNPVNQKLFPSRSDVKYIANGVDLARYESAHQIPNDIKDLPRPLLGYIGSIQNRLNVGIIKQLAADFRNGSLVLIGPLMAGLPLITSSWYRYKRSELNDLKKIENIHFLGRKSRVQAPAYIQNFDVCLLPFKNTSFSSSTEPMKVYEYLAAGKPVVTTTSQEFGQRAQYLYQATDPAGFSQSVSKALKEDNEDLQKQRKLSVADCDWSKRLEEMMQDVYIKLKV